MDGVVLAGGAQVNPCTLAPVDSSDLSGAVSPTYNRNQSMVLLATGELLLSTLALV
jgi:hypothetical protein